MHTQRRLHTSPIPRPDTFVTITTRDREDDRPGRMGWHTRDGRGLTRAGDLPGPPRQDAARGRPDSRGCAGGHDKSVTIAPITSTIKGLNSEVSVGPDNGLEQLSVISLDNVVTIPANLLGRTVGFLSSEQEMLLAKAIVLAYDLDIALLDT